MGRIIVDLSRLGNLTADDIIERHIEVPPLPQAAPLYGPKEMIIRDALSAAVKVGSKLAKTYLDVLDLPSAPPTYHIISPTTLAAPVSKHLFAPVYVRFPGSSCKDFTIALGPNYTATAVAGLTAGYGLYASTTPREAGIYGYGGGGLWSSVGLSAGAQVTVLYAPLSAFKGWSWGMEIGISSATPISIGGSATAIFSLPSGSPLTINFLGFSYTMSASTGVSLLGPVSVSISATYASTIKVF